MYNIWNQLFVLQLRLMSLSNHSNRYKPTFIRILPYTNLYIHKPIRSPSNFYSSVPHVGIVMELFIVESHCCDLTKKIEYFFIKITLLYCRGFDGSWGSRFLVTKKTWRKINIEFELPPPTGFWGFFSKWNTL